MPKAVTQHEWTFVCSEDRNAEDPKYVTTFKLSKLNTSDFGMAQSMMGAGGASAMHDFVFYVCERGIIGWDNFLNEKGSQIPFERSGRYASRKTLQSFTFEVLVEIAGEIMLQSQATAEKKSS
jgi:hypothetical protein